MVVPTVVSLTEMPIISPSVNREFMSGRPHSVSVAQKCASICSGCGFSVMLENSMLSIWVTVRVSPWRNTWPTEKRLEIEAAARMAKSSGLHGCSDHNFKLILTMRVQSARLASTAMTGEGGRHARQPSNDRVLAGAVLRQARHSASIFGLGAIRRRGRAGARGERARPRLSLFRSTPHPCAPRRRWR